MKKNFTLLATALVMGISVNAQQINGEISMGSAYANDVYFGLADQTIHSTDRNNWDIAFYRKSNYSVGVRINDTKGIQVLEASNNLNNWASVNVANEANWTELYNSDTDWQEGAFNQGSASYGWGEYDMASHQVKGSVIFVLRYNSGEYVKFKINKMYSGYDFTFAKLNNGTWGEDVTVNVPHNSSSDRMFNYYNFLTQEVVTPEPTQAEWDLKFTKYITPLEYGDDVMMYSVTGVLQSDLIIVAKPESGNPVNDEAYKAEINTIGYDWKTFTGSTYTISDINHFVKNTSTNKIYKLVFTEFAGSSTGNIKFTYEDVTNNLGTTSFDKVKFDIYNEAGRSKTINIVLNSQEALTENVQVQVYSMNGQLVHQEAYKPTSSFSNKSINLSKLTNGVYIVNVSNSNFKQSKKIILK